MADIPQEIRIDILSRLPVKSLLRFKSVCKPWYRLICDPGFVKTHRERAIRNGTSPFLILHYKPNRIVANAFYKTDYTSKLSSLMRGNRYPLRDSVEMEYPLMPPGYLDLLGSYHGLLLLRASGHVFQDAVCLWNPSTREYKHLPGSPNHYRSCIVGMDITLYGLGYDNTTDDFKVIRVAEIDSRFHSFADVSGSEFSTTRTKYSVFEIYSLRSNSWKRCQTVQYYFADDLKPAVVVKEVLHWLAIKRGDGYEAIISFDFTEEIFKEVAILGGPMKHPSGNDSDYENNHLGMLGGCICVLHKTLYKVDIWVMMDYGVNESWTKRFTIGRQSIVESCTLRVICDFPDGTVLFGTDDSLVYHDPNRKKGTKKLKVLGTNCLKGAEICMTSLVSLSYGETWRG